MDNTKEQLVYWKAQYEKIIDENIMLKEKSLLASSPDLLGEHKVDILQQENYGLKQNVLRLKRDLQSVTEEAQEIAHEK